MLSLLFLMIILFSSYIFCSSASLISEKTGVANISVEGNMIMGAAFSVLLMSYFDDNEMFKMFDSVAWSLIFPMISIFLSGIFVTVFSMFFSLITVKLYGDQIIAGTAVNMIAPALSATMLYLFFNSEVNSSNNFKINKPDEVLAVSGQFEWLYPMILLIFAIILIVSIYFIYSKTKTGLRMKAAGENPYALETAGVSVHRIRILVLLCAGFLSGFAGGIWSIAEVTDRFNSTVFGAGFLAIGIVIFAQWKIELIAIGALIVSFFSVLVSTAAHAVLGVLSPELTLILRITPYIIPIIILIIFKSTGSPKSLGVPFKKDQR